jgi:hypothetical protein
VTETHGSSSKIEILRNAVARVQAEADVPRDSQDARLGTHTIAVPFDRVIAKTVSELPPTVLRKDRPGDVLEAYVADLKSLCVSTGGTWVDDDPDRAVGCYFRTDVEAAGYAVLTWTCLPGRVLRFILG